MMPRRTTKRLSLLLAAGMLLSRGALATEPQVDKSQYNLFNPTPPSLMREFEPDRPDLTDSAFTVDAGHVQVEADISNYTLSRPDLDRTVTEKFLFAPTDIRVGTTNNTEIDVLVQPFNAVRKRYPEPFADTWNAGLDVLEIGAKLNLYGNDTFEKPGAIVVAVRSFIEIPTVRNGVGEEDFEGGTSIPVAIKLTDRTELEMMSEFNFIRNDEGSGYHVEYFNTASLRRDWTPALSTYLEVATLFGNEDPFGSMVTVGTGILYEPIDNLQIDFSTNFGLTRASDQINIVIGIAKRF